MDVAYGVATFLRISESESESGETCYYGSNVNRSPRSSEIIVNVLLMLKSSSDSFHVTPQRLRFAWHPTTRAFHAKGAKTGESNEPQNVSSDFAVWVVTSSKPQERVHILIGDQATVCSYDRP